MQERARTTRDLELEMHTDETDGDILRG